MSYNKSCNVDVLKTFDLRVRPVNNVSPGLYSTLAAGPQQVYGSPLTWEYILLISDVQNIKVQHSTIISNDYLILSTNVRYISTYLDNNISTLSSYLYTNYKNLENTNVYLQGTLLYNVSNYYEQTNSIRYPSSLSTIISNYSTLSTVIYRLLPTLTYLSTTSTLYEYEISTIQTLNNRIQPLISTLSSYNINYSTILYRNLNQSESNIQSTVSTSIYNYLLRQSTTFSRFESILSNTSSYLFSSFSTQYFIYSTINGTFLNENVNTVKTQFSSLSSIIGYQYSSVDELYNKSILGSISTAQVNGRNAINSNLQTITSSISNTYSTLSTTIGTQQNILNSNTAFLGNLQQQYSTYKMLSTQVLQLSFYSTISRPQTFFEIDFYLNNIQISSYYWHSSIGARDLQTNQSIAAAYLESQYNYNSSILSSLFASNTSNAYYNIIKAYRANNIPLIDRISNSIPSTFINPSLISTAYGQYSTQVRSSVSQTYKIVIQSERLAIRNTSNVFITATQLTNSRSSIVGSAFISLSNEMRLLTSTSFNNLISYTFGSFRSNSELTLRILNQAESANNSILSNYITNITDHTIQDSYYYNLSTLFYSDFSTTKGMLTSTTISHLNNDSTFIIYLSSTSSLSTFYYSNISSFLSTLNYSTNVYSISSLSSANAFNLSTLSSFNSYLGPITSSISTYLTNFVYSTLSSSIDYNYLSLSNVAEEISSSLFSTLYGISNKVDIFNASQGYRIYSSIILCNAIASNALYNVYCNSINLSVNQIVLSTFTTISSIYVNAPMTMFEGGAKLVQEKRSPLQIEHYDRAGVHNLLYVNPTKNEVVVNNLVINGNLQLVLSNTVSTLSLDLNKYQNFYAEIQTMSNANPTIELNVNLSTNSKYTQQGYINININPASANEIAAKRFLNIINLGPTIRLNITNTYGYLRYKYLSQNGKVFISQNYDFTKTTSSILPAGNVNTITNTNNANFIGLVTDSIGNLYATDINTNAVLKYDIISGTLNTFVDGFNIPYNLTIDSNNNLYVTSFADNTIYKVTSLGVKTVVCTVSSPIGIVVDSTATNLYVSSLSTRQIYRINLTDSAPTAVAFVGSGAAGNADGIGLAATFRLVFGMTIDSSQTMYVTDYGNNSIRKIVLSTNLVTTIAGSTDGLAGNTIGNTDISPHTLTNAIEDGFQGLSARFNKPSGIIADNLGNLFVCDSGNFAIRRIVITTGDIITISGIENGGYLDGTILEAKYKQLYGIVINAGKTNLYACDLNKIRQVGYNINALTGNSASQINENTTVEAATRYAVTLLDSNSSRPVIMSCVVDSNHKLFLLSVTGIIYKYDTFTQSLTVFATLPTNAGYGITIELFTNSLYATDGLSSVFEIDPDLAINDRVTTIVSSLNQPRAITVNTLGTKLYVGCSGAIFELTLGGITTNLFSYTGSNQTWTPASGVTSVYVLLKGAGGGCYADYSFYGSPGGTVSGALSVTPSHSYTIIVGRGGESSGGWWTGQGQGGYGGGGSGSGGQYGGSGGGGRSAIQFTAGTDIVTAGGGAGSYNFTQGGVGGDPNGGGATNGTPYQGDTGPYTGGGGGGFQGGGPGKGGTSYIANLIGGSSTAGTAGNAVHGDPGVYGNGSIVIISGIKVLAGGSTTGYLDGIGLSASLDSYISGLTLTSGILYFSEYNNQLIRKLTLTTSNVVTVSGTAGITGSGNGLGKNAQFNGPRDIKTDLSGNLYISDLINNAIRKIDITTATVTTLIGNTGSNSYPSANNPDGFLNQAKLFGPYGIAFDNPAPATSKDLYVIDGYGQLVRSFYATSNIASFPMSTIINYDNSSIFVYKSLMSSIVIQTSTITSQTYNQYLNTLTAYNNTLSAPPSAQKSVFVTSASNAVLNTITQSNLVLNASTITSVNYLSVITISTLASAQFTTISYNANVYLSNVSNLYIESQCNSNTAYTAFQSASASAATASDAYTGAVNAATQSNIEVNYAYTGSDQSFTVPAGVTKITVELLGAGGSTAYTGGGNGPDAQGGYVYGDLAVIAGQTYTVVVGGQNNNGYAQYGGGGAGSYSYGGSGGGRSALVLNGSDVVTAGGGGGDAYYTGGGQGGGLVGQNGYYGAGGGSQTAGGAASGYGAQNGYYQNGGYGSGYGAGGGGGYYGGGGGGGWSYGGGGGSSYVALLTGTVINTQGGGAYAGYHASEFGGDGHGRIKITYSVSTGGGGGTTPFQLTFSGCSFWFDASDTTSITATGTSVTSWANKGTTGGSASIGSGTPLTNFSTINGLNAVSFGQNVYMNFISALGGTGAVTFFCITKITSDMTTGNAGIDLIISPTFFGLGQRIAYDSSNTNYQLWAYTYNYGIWNVQTFSQGSNIQNKTYLYTTRSGTFDAGAGVPVNSSTPNTNRSFINGVSGTLTTNLNGVYYTTSLLYNIPSPSANNSLEMGEMLIYNRALTDSEITQINSYLVLKWGINLPSIAAPLITWFDGNYGLTTTSWKNRGTNGGSATLSGVTITTQNSLNAANFTDGNSYGAFTPVFTGNSRAVFAVYKANSAGNNKSIVLISQVNQQGPYWYTTASLNASGNAQFFQVMAGNQSAIISDPAVSLPITNMAVVAITYDDTGSTNSYVTYNGTILASLYYSGAYYFNNQISYLNGGGNSGGAAVSDVGITLCELLIYDGVVSPADGIKIQDYLANKWGLTVAPNAPTFVSQSITSGTYNMAWQRATSGGVPASYTVTIQQSANNSTWTTVATHTVSITTDTYNSLTADYYYRFSVTATNSIATSSSSSPSSGVQYSLVPDTPIFGSEAIVGSSYNITWTNALTGGSPTSYVVTIQESVDNADWSTVATSTPSSANYEYSSLTTNYYYRFRVLARNANGDSSPTSYSSGVQNQDAVPGTPTSLSQSFIGDSYTMSWVAGSGGIPTSYTVTVQFSPNNIKYGGNTNSTVYTTSDTYMSAVYNYYYRFSVVATNGAGSSSSSGYTTGIQNIPL